MVKTSPSSAGGVSSICSQRAKIPLALWPKNPKHKRESNIVAKLIKTSKMVHIKNLFKK